MTLRLRLFSAAYVAVAMAVHVSALGQSPDGSTTKRTQDNQTKPVPKVTYGLCDLAQNADASPSQPIAVTNGQCHHFQQFSATSITANYGASCGGYTVVFGPLGDLKPSLRDVSLIAEWGDAPLTAATCGNARVAAQAWGERCLDDACASFEPQKIGGPQQVKGSWHAVSQTCYLKINFGSNSPDKKYRMLNLDIITSLIEDGKAVRKRAKGTIRAQIGNGKCPQYEKKTDPPPKKL